MTSSISGVSSSFLRLCLMMSCSMVVGLPFWSHSDTGRCVVVLPASSSCLSGKMMPTNENQKRSLPHLVSVRVRVKGSGSGSCGFGSGFGSGSGSDSRWLAHQRYS